MGSVEVRIATFPFVVTTIQARLLKKQVAEIRKVNIQSPWDILSDH